MQFSTRGAQCDWFFWYYNSVSCWGDFTLVSLWPWHRHWKQCLTHMNISKSRVEVKSIRSSICCPVCTLFEFFWPLVGAKTLDKLGFVVKWGLRSLLLWEALREGREIKSTNKYPGNSQFQERKDLLSLSLDHLAFRISWTWTREI